MDSYDIRAKALDHVGPPRDSMHQNAVDDHLKQVRAVERYLSGDSDQAEPTEDLHRIKLDGVSIARSDHLSFAAALHHLKQGRAVARSGWNGKGMILWMVRGNDPDDGNEQSHIDGIDQALFDKGHEGTVPRLPHIAMRSASGATVTGWLASQSDLLAEDWHIVSF